jgi:Flp pilus assembly protein protease CpaA
MLLRVLLMWAPFIFVLSVLTYVFVLDFKTRTVSNWVWVFAYPIGCAMTLASIVFNLTEISAVLISFGCSLFLGVGLLCSGFYGGADAKALIFLGLSLPVVPFTFSSALGISVLPVVLAVFCTSAILSLVWPLSIFVLNLKDLFVMRKAMFDGISLTLRQRVWLFFTARKVPIEKLGGLRYFPAEQVVLLEGEPTRVLVHFVKAETNLEKYWTNLLSYGELYRGGVLVSPTIPSTCFLWVALIVLSLVGLLF